MGGIEKLGKPQGSEQSYGDGTGAFQVYEHGAIFTHPEFGTHMIDRVKFEKYKSENLEKGKLGYLISDSKKLPDGQLCNDFQDGKICTHITKPEEAYLSKATPRQYSQYKFLKTATKSGIKITNQMFALKQVVSSSSIFDYGV